MDCEKFEATLIDELYDELDELTSAAHKRHVAGCARCASLLSGLKATRRVAVLPMLDVPAGLEEKILAAARDAQKVVPLRVRVSRVVSLAGSWAMRPQTAMAAVFLLMIGSSLLLLQSRSAKEAASTASGEMVVTGQGSPTTAAASAAAPAAADETAALDTRAAAGAHGALEGKPLATAAPVAAATASSLDQQQLALRGTADGLGKAGNTNDPYATNAAAPAGAPVAQSGAYGGAYPGQSQAPATPPAEQGAVAGGDYGSAMAAYNAHNYLAATRGFDALAAQGDQNAALWAARSVREGSGCAAAVTRFDQVKARAYGTNPGYDATLEGGRCYRVMGSFDIARSRFQQLLTVPAYEARARTELASMQPPAAAAPMRARSKPAAMDNSRPQGL